MKNRLFQLLFTVCISSSLLAIDTHADIGDGSSLFNQREENPNTVIYNNNESIFSNDIQNTNGPFEGSVNVLPPPPGGGGPSQEVPIPLDGGVSLLLITGIGVGLSKVIRRQLNGTGQ